MLKLCDKTCLEIKETLFVLVSLLGGKKGQINIAMSFSQKKKVFQKKMVISKKRDFFVQSLLVTQEIKF